VLSYLSRYKRSSETGAGTQKLRYRSRNMEAQIQEGDRELRYRRRNKASQQQRQGQESSGTEIGIGEFINKVGISSWACFYHFVAEVMLLYLSS
jgi:hypothetical protein